MTKQKICPICKTTFISVISSQKYCCIDCADEARREITRKCVREHYRRRKKAAEDKGEIGETTKEIRAICEDLGVDYEELKEESARKEEAGL